MSILVFLLLFGTTTAQNQPASEQPGNVRAQAQQKFLLEDLDHLTIQVQQRSTQNTRRSLDDIPFADADICFAIRSYVFDRQDGNAPVLVGTSTCTPGSTIVRRRVGNPPKARLVPQ
jgi:hypothetical protein